MKHSLFILFNIALAVGYITEFPCPAEIYPHSGIDGMSLNNSYINTGKDTANKPTHTIIRSSSGMGGSSKTLTTATGTYSVSQSIGQSSVIGTGSQKRYAILQGFQQPLLSVKVVRSVENDLKATVYPNPFSQSINILFDKEIKSAILITLTDAHGRTIITKKFPASKHIHLPLGNITSGVYVIKIIEGTRSFSAKLIKQYP